MKKNVVIVFVLLLGIGIGCGGYFCVDKFMNQNKNDQSENEKPNDDEQGTEIENLDINSSIVRRMASDLKIGEGSESKLRFYEYVNEKNKFLVSDFSAEYKNYLGFRQLGNAKMHRELCSDYPNEELGIFCDEPYEYTTVFSEQDLKDEVERIFGIGSYSSVNFFGASFASYPNTEDVYGFYYKSNSKDYFSASRGGGANFGYTLKASIDSASKQNNTVIIIENVEINYYEKNSKESAKYKYIFHYGNGNYQFESVEIIK